MGRGSVVGSASSGGGRIFDARSPIKVALAV
jgi:hypothetical protein